MEDFVHLHVHTYYSILDGQSSIKKLVDKAIGDGMKGMAITDHGDMFGIKERKTDSNPSSPSSAVRCMWPVVATCI